MSEKHEKRNYREVRVRGVSESLINDLNNISKNTGVSISDLLKPKLHEIRDSFPERLRRKPELD